MVIRNKTRVYDGFFKLDEVTFSHRRYDGAMSADMTHLVFERGDAVAALIYNVETDRVILVEQFRIPAADKGRAAGWMQEPLAGMIRNGETALEAITRETLEETGYRIKDPELIATFFSSPGGTSERIFLYYAVVRDKDRVATGGGTKAEGEDIRIISLAPSDLFEQLRSGVLEDGKLVVAAYHLKDRLRVKPETQKPLGSGTIRYRHKAKNGRILGIKTGPILSIDGVEVWVNSENTDMMMDRIIGKTISANIRYGGGRKSSQGDLDEDIIADELRRGLRRRAFVRRGTIIETGAGDLVHKGVRKIYHIASVEGQGPGGGVRAAEADITDNVQRILTHLEKHNGGLRLLTRRYTSVLIPMMGAGDGGLEVDIVARRTVETVEAHLTATPSTHIQDIYLLAFTPADLAAIQNAIAQTGRFTPLAE